MISIITAVYNQLKINQLFWESLARHNSRDFELIIIDNGSTDGSAEFFESVGARVIRNSANYSYPYCQNQGIRVARYDWLAFLNNDIIVSPRWDERLLQSMAINNLEVATACGIEHLQSRAATKAIKRRWRLLRNLITLFGANRETLSLAHRLMYGDWQRFCDNRHNDFRHKIKEGFVGCAIMMHRGVIDKIGLWDERIQSADYDLYLRTKERSLKHGDIRPVHICLDVFVHHFIKITLKSGHPEFVDRQRLISLQEKWPKDYLILLDHLDD